MPVPVPSTSSVDLPARMASMAFCWPGRNDVKPYSFLSRTTSSRFSPCCASSKSMPSTSISSASSYVGPLPMSLGGDEGGLLAIPVVNSAGTSTRSTPPDQIAKGTSSPLISLVPTIDVDGPCSIFLP